MSASQEKRLNSPEKIGIIAGGGEIPGRLVAACREQNIEPFVIAFEGQTQEKTVEDTGHVWTQISAVSKILKALKAEGISDLVIIGHIKRPSLKEFRFDMKAAEFIAKEGLKVIGDDGLLKALRRFLEKEGFRLHGVQNFLPDLLMPQGYIGRVEASAEHLEDIRRGVDVLQALGAQDIGQAVIVQQGHVLGVEAAEGTDELIQRCGPLKREGSAPVLVKLSKPGQDQDLDLPTIGPQTIENAAAAGLAGIATQAAQSFIHDMDAVKDQADKHGLFVIGIEPKTLGKEA